MKIFLSFLILFFIPSVISPFVNGVSTKEKIYKKIENSFPYGKSIVKISFEEGIDPQLTAAIILHESKGDIYAIGSSGERGLMQVMKYHFDDSEWEFAFSPDLNIRRGLKVFKDCLRVEMRKNEVDYVLRSLSCYNAGPNRKSRVIQKYEQAVIKQYKKLGEI